MWDFAEKAKSPATESLFGAEHASITRREQQYFWTPAAQGKAAEAVWQSTVLVTTLSAASAFTSQSHCTKDCVGRAAAASISQHTHMVVTTAYGPLHWEHLALVTAGREAPQLVASMWAKQSAWRDAEPWICPWRHSGYFLLSCWHYPSHSSFTHKKKKQLLLSIIIFECFQTQYVEKFLLIWNFESLASLHYQQHLGEIKFVGTTHLMEPNFNYFHLINYSCLWKHVLRENMLCL